MSHLNAEIRTALAAYDVERARELLRSALPSADAETYYLAAQAALDKSQKIAFLEEALALDPFYPSARDELNTLHNLPPKNQANGEISPLLWIARLTASFVLVFGAAMIFAFNTTPLSGVNVTVNPADNAQPALMLSDVSGTWSGHMYYQGHSVEYTMTITQDGTAVSGRAWSVNDDGQATVRIRGTYENGILDIEGYDGTYDGWSGLCYVDFVLTTGGTYEHPHVVGDFEPIPNDDGTCFINGEAIFLRD